MESEWFNSNIINARSYKECSIKNHFNHAFTAGIQTLSSYAYEYGLNNRLLLAHQNISDCSIRVFSL